MFCGDGDSGRGGWIHRAAVSSAERAGGDSGSVGGQVAAGVGDCATEPAGGAALRGYDSVVADGDDHQPGPGAIDWLYAVANDLRQGDGAAANSGEGGDGVANDTGGVDAAEME